MKQKRDEILNRFMEVLQTDDVMWANEVRANIFVSFAMMTCAFLLLLAWILNICRLFTLNIDTFNLVVLFGVAELIIPFCLCIYYKGRKKWIKFLLLIDLIVLFAGIDSVLVYRVTLLMVLPVVLSTRYYSKRVTSVVAAVSAIVFLLSSVLSVYLGIVNINDVVMEKGTVIIAEGGLLHTAVRNTGIETIPYIRSIIINTYFPKFILFAVIAVVCIEIAARSKELVLKQAELTRASVQIHSELKTASRIQANMLPNVFPAFPNHKEFDLFANMIAAKSVGGDFYDFFMIDDRHLALIIADVSDKGIPAALFMVVTKTLIKSNMQEYSSVSEVFNKVNNLLCEENRSDFFVTAWLGVLDIETGKVEFVNAGHNNPIIGHNGRFTEINQKHEFVLAAMEDVRYVKQEFTLEENDVLFIYTDGITDACASDKELYGVNRLIDSLNRANNESMEDLTFDVKKDIHDFIDGNEQFDDMTLLALRYKGRIEEMVLESNVENGRVLTDYINEKLESIHCPMKTMYQIDVAIDEIFANICEYAYAPLKGKIDVKIKFKEEPLTIVLEFEDCGEPFNPLKREDPDISLSAEERDEGGLGIFMVKKMMDSVEYDYKDGKNIVTIKKVLE